MFLRPKQPYKSPMVVTCQMGKKETYRQTHSSLTKLQVTHKAFLRLGNNQFPEQVGSYLKPSYFSSPSSSQWKATSQLGAFCHTSNEDTHCPPRDQARNLTHSLPDARQLSMLTNGALWHLNCPHLFTFHFSKESLCLKWTSWKPEIENPSRSVWMIPFEEIPLLGGQGLSALWWDPC